MAARIVELLPSPPFDRYPCYYREARVYKITNKINRVACLQMLDDLELVIYYSVIYSMLLVLLVLIRN